MLISRRRRAHKDRFLPLKSALLLVGAGLGLVGMRSDNTVLVNVAAGIVLAGVLLRFLPQHPGKPKPPDQDPPAL